MLKRDEIANPESCWNKARDDERVFILLERDVASPHAIREWAKKRVEYGKNHLQDLQIAEAYRCADVMDATRIEALPDGYADALVKARQAVVKIEHTAALLAAGQRNVKEDVGSRSLVNEARQEAAQLLIAARTIAAWCESKNWDLPESLAAE